MYSPYPNHIQGGAGQPGHHAPLPAYNPNLNTAAAAGLPPNPSHGHQPPPPQQHHMMYNPHQYAHQSPYGAGNPMMTGMPQMHNGGMAHSGGNSNGVPHYQTPYTSSPYGSGIPTSTAGPGQPQPYQAPFAMNMQQQHMQQRMMQPMQPPTGHTPSSMTPSGPSRASPYPPPALPHQMTPPNASTPQFAPHPSQAQQPQNQQQNSHQSHQSISQSIGGNQNHGGQNQQQTTPSTPTFLPPLSPGAENLEKERVGMLLDINRDLLMEVMRLQALQAEIKKEAENDPNIDPEKKILAQNDWMACMRRIQANLAYLAACADRSHKHTQIPPHPAFMLAPPLSQSSTSFTFSSPMMTNVTAPKLEDHPHSPNNPAPPSTAETDMQIDKESRIHSLKANYKKLQELFNMSDAELKSEMKKEQEFQARARMQTPQQHQQQQKPQMQQGFPQNQQLQSPLSSGGQQRPPSQQMNSNMPNMPQNNMNPQMVNQFMSSGQQQQHMNMAMNSAMGIPSMSPSPGIPGNGGMMDMGFQRGLPGGGMQR